MFGATVYALPPAWALLGYIVAIAFFARGIKMLTSPKTAHLGNRVAGVGMLIAIGVTLGQFHVGWQYIVPAAALGAIIGAVWALRVPMTAMPQMVAMFNGMGGGAAALIALGDFHRLTLGGVVLGPIDSGTILLSCLIGSISFAGSMIAFAKLQELMTGRAITYPGQQVWNGIVGVGILGLGIAICVHPVHWLIAVVVGLALIFGVAFVLPIGGADVPVLISVLNSFTGLAVAQAQHTIRELADLLEQRGVEVIYAIHPVAGRMPGHMNVLLAEANVPYDQLKEMDEANPEFQSADVALVVGANDVVNPAAKNDPKSPIYGMPILEVEEARNIVFMKRSMRPGFAGIDNELLFDPKTTLLFGDAKDSLTKVVAAVKAL